MAVACTPLTHDAQLNLNKHFVPGLQHMPNLAASHTALDKTRSVTHFPPPSLLLSWAYHILLYVIYVYDIEFWNTLVVNAVSHKFRT